VDKMNKMVGSPVVFHHVYYSAIAIGEGQDCIKLIYLDGENRATAAREAAMRL